MAFSFGFVSDEDDVGEGAGDREEPGQAHDGAGENPYRKPVTEHRLDDLLRALPERISYSVGRIESPTGRTLDILRRDLHDVRVQLLAEEDESNDEIVDHLDTSDIRSGVYEGGFKTWECSLDLASLLLDRGPRKDIDELIRCDQVVELGAGTALPTLVLFQHALHNAMSLTFTLSDYNDAVLRLVTLPNLILTWAAATRQDGLHPQSLQPQAQGDLELPPSLVEQFRSDLRDKGIELKFLSGPWSPALAALVPSSAPEMGTLVLGAETIYSPASTAAFVALLVALLRRVKMAKAMIAAKRVYFGVGGSVDGLKEACREMDAVAYEIENHGVPGMDGGVGRALVEVQMY